MQRSKNLAVMFLLGAVLVGGALGFSADRVMIRDRICVARTSSRSMREMLADRLQLSQTQRSKVDSILDERRRLDQLVMATVRDQMDSVRMRARAQIERVLNENQREEFHRLLAELNDTTRTREKD